MARFTETVDIRPASTFQYDASSLTNRLDQFAQQQSQIHAQQTAERSMAAGQAAFQEGEQPQFKEEKFFGSVGSKAYNKGLRAAYLASMDRDNREEIGRIVAENPSDLTKFNDEVENYRKALLSSVDPSARVMAADSLDSLVSANRIKVQSNEIEKTHKENALEVSNAIEAATSDALGFARDGQDEAAAQSAITAFAAVQGAVDAGFINDEQAKNQRRDIERGMVEEKTKGGVFDTLDSDGIQAAYGQLDDLSRNRQSGFTPDEWDGFVANTQTELNRRVARLQRQAVEDAKRQKVEQDFASIEKRIDGDDSIVINPKVADVYYQERIEPAISKLPPEAQRTVQARYMDRLKLVPDTMVKELTNAANSDNPDLLANAADLVDRIDEIPGIVNKVPTDQQAYLQTVSDLMQNMEAAEAVKVARAATDPKDKARIEAVNTQIKELNKDKPGVYRERAENAFQSLFTFGDPSLDEVSGDKITKEYKDIAENFMRAGATQEVAFNKADKFIKRTWGETESLGETRVMKYPPERYYSIDGDASWIRPQLMVDLSENIAGITPEEVFLVSGDTTARTASAGRPAYLVVAKIDGVLTPVLGKKGKDIYWAPDYDAEVKRRRDQNIKDAMKEREKLINATNFDHLSSGMGAL